MHVVDSLDPGGAERMAVNLVNALPRERYAPFLCTTRREGDLADTVAADVGRLRLGRQQRFDPAAVLAARRYITEHRIRIVHAHSSSIFLARLASLLAPATRVVWHDHFGRQLEERPRWLYKLATAGIGGVIAVSEDLADWSRGLGTPPESVFYIPNFVLLPAAAGTVDRGSLPGEDGHRIVCVANLRWQKNHRALVAAMAQVARSCPRAHLLLVGGHGDPSCRRAVEEQIRALSLTSRISLLGHRSDVAAVLSACDVAVLSSSSEGFPLALLEYGAMGLASVATTTGQCGELLDHGRAGILVAPGDVDGLARALIDLLQDAALRRRLGERFRDRVERTYAPGAVMDRICRVYEQVLAA